MLPCLLTLQGRSGCVAAVADFAAAAALDVAAAVAAIDVAAAVAATVWEWPHLLLTLAAAILLTHWTDDCVDDRCACCSMRL